MNKNAALSAVSLAALLLAAPAKAAEPTWVTEIPAFKCTTTAPDVGCITTLPLDLRAVTRFRLSVQALNYMGPNPQGPAVINLRDVSNLAAPCFGAKCPTMTVPVTQFALGPCCSPYFTSEIIFIPPAQRRQGVRLRLDVTGGNLTFFEREQKPLVQFYRDPRAEPSPA